MKNKRGLSGVVTTLILILLSLVAVGVIWVVIANLISTGSEEIEIGSLTTQIKVEKVLTSGTQTEIILSRDTGQGEINGVKIVLSDGTNSESFELTNSPLNQLEKKVYTVDYSGIVKSVAVAPLLKTESGKVKVGKIVETKEYSSVEAIKNMQGLVSWWRMEANGDDEMRNNPCINFGAFPTQGKFGQGYGFDGTPRYINCTTNPSLDSQNISISAWIKTTNPLSTQYITEDHAGPTRFSSLLILNSNIIFAKITGPTAAISSQTIQANTFYNIVGTYDGTIQKVYVNGEISGTSNIGLVAPTPTDEFVIGKDIISGGFIFNGTIDEVMVFNRSLSDNEVKSLYNLQF